MLLYRILNTVNGKLYIGLTTTSLKKRWSEHLCNANIGNRRPLYAAMRKYGANSFMMEEIACLAPGMDLDDLRQMERDLITQENCKSPRGYNLTDGGDGVTGYEFTDEVRAKMRAKWTPERRAAIAERLRQTYTGRKLSPEHKEKVVATLRRSRKLTADERRIASEKRCVTMARKRADGYVSANVGRKASAETRAKQSDAKRRLYDSGYESPLAGLKISAVEREVRNAKRSETYRLKKEAGWVISYPAGRKGKPLSEDHKAKLSAWRTEFYARKRAEQEAIH